MNVRNAISGEGSPELKFYGYAGQSYTDTLTGDIWGKPDMSAPGTTGWIIIAVGNDTPEDQLMPRDGSGNSDTQSDQFVANILTDRIGASEIDSSQGAQILTEIGGASQADLETETDNRIYIDTIIDGKKKTINFFSFDSITPGRRVFWELGNTGNLTTDDFTLSGQKYIPTALPTQETIFSLSPSESDAKGTGSFAINIEAAGIVVSTHNATGSRFLTYTIPISAQGQISTLTVTRDGNSVAFYINGTAIIGAETTAGTSVPEWGQSLVTTYLLVGGTYDGSSSTSPAGIIGAPLLWNSVFSAADVSFLISTGISESNLVPGGRQTLKLAANFTNNQGYSSFTLPTTTGFTASKGSTGGHRGAGFRLFEGVTIGTPVRFRWNLVLNSGVLPYLAITSTNDASPVTNLGQATGLSSGLNDRTITPTASSTVAWSAFGQSGGNSTNFTISDFSATVTGLIVAPELTGSRWIPDASGNNITGTVMTGVSQYVGSVWSAAQLSSSSGEVALLPPSGFSWEPGFKVYRDAAGVARTTFDWRSMMRTPATMLYVDGRTGNDINSGASWADAFATLSALMADVAFTAGANPIQINIRGNTFYGRTQSIDNTPQDGIEFGIISSEGRARLANGDQLGSFSWIQEGSPNEDVWSTTVSQAVGDVRDELVIDGDGYFTRYPEVDSIVECQALAGSWFLDTTTLYVHTLRSDEPDNAVVAYYTDETNVITSQRRVFLQGIDFEGITEMDPYAAGEPEPLTVVDCRFLYGDGEALLHRRAGTTHYINCICAQAGGDGFSYANPQSGTQQERILEENCTGIRNGWFGGGNNNGSTAHGGVIVIRVYGTYALNVDKNVHDIQTGTQSWNVGSTAFTITDDNQDANANWVNGGSSQVSEMWIDGCLSDDGEVDFRNVGPGIMYLRCMNTSGKIFLEENNGPITGY